MDSRMMEVNMTPSDSVLRDWLGGIPRVDPAAVRLMNRLVHCFDTEDAVRGAVERIGSWLSDWFRQRMAKRICLQLEISEPDSGSSRLVNCPERRRFTIGRSRSADVRVSDPSVSSLHVDLCADPREGLICDDSCSSNGARIDSVPFRGRRIVVWPGRHLLELGRVSIIIQRVELPMVSNPIGLRVERIWSIREQDVIGSSGTAGIVFDMSGFGGIRMSLACPAAAATDLLALLFGGDLDGKEGIPGPIERMILLGAAGSIVDSIRKDFAWGSIQLIGVRTEGITDAETGALDSPRIGIPITLRIADREYPLSIRFGSNVEMTSDIHPPVRSILLEWFSDTPIVCAFVAGHVALPLSICNGLVEGDAMLVPFASGASWDGERYAGSLRLAVVGDDCIEIAEGVLMIGRSIDSMEVQRLLQVGRPVLKDIELMKGGDEVTQENGCGDEGKICSEAIESISIDLTIELARCRIPLKQVLSLRSGEVIGLPARLDGAVEIYCGLKHFGSGRLLQVGERLGVQITQIVADSVMR